MGTSIQLTVGNVSLSYAKNNMGNDYGFLFQEGDIARRRSDNIDYEHYAEHPDELGDLETSELAFVRPLSRIIPRLQLLGHTLGSARAEYQSVVDDACLYSDQCDSSGGSPKWLTFEEFCDLANRYPLAELSTADVDCSLLAREELAVGKLSAHSQEFARLPDTESGLYWSEQSYFSHKVCILSPESMLQVFALNPKNADAEVVWAFGPIVHAGWVDRSMFEAGVGRQGSILVVTEGSSDARILRRALEFLRPDVKDFFRFIDGDERHHFWGTGNLVKFAEGLIRIDIQNKVLFVLDNDTEGVAAHQKLQALSMPESMRSMVLPDIEELRSFPAVGPEGVSNSDINGRAASIECYLDLGLPGLPSAQVTWSNYRKEMALWHGALDHKDSYTDYFLKQDAGTFEAGNYDATKLIKVLDALISEASLLKG